MWMWDLDPEEGSKNWTKGPKNWCFLIVVLEKTLESTLDTKEVTPVNPKGNQPLIFIGRTDADAKALILWPADAKIWFIGKNPAAGKDWGQEKKGMTEDEMDVWYHWLDSMDMTLRKLQEFMKDRIAWIAAVYRTAKSQTWLSNWTTIISFQVFCLFFNILQLL